MWMECHGDRYVTIKYVYLLVLLAISSLERPRVRVPMDECPRRQCDGPGIQPPAGDIRLIALNVMSVLGIFQRKRNAHSTIQL